MFHDILREFAPEYNDIVTVIKKIKKGNDQFSDELNRQFTNQEQWTISGFLSKKLTDQEIQKMVTEAKEGQSCEYSQFALQRGDSPYRYKTFPPVQAPIEENCKLGFIDEKERMIYTTLVSLYKSLDRFYSHFGFLAQTKKLKSDFEK